VKSCAFCLLELQVTEVQQNCWYIKTIVLWLDWRKMQNFIVAVAKDYMLTNKVWETKEISYTQQWNKPKPSLSNLQKTKVLCYSNTKNVAAKPNNLYLILGLSQDIYGGCKVFLNVTPCCSVNGSHHFKDYWLCLPLEGKQTITLQNTGTTDGTAQCYSAVYLNPQLICGNQNAANQIKT